MTAEEIALLVKQGEGSTFEMKGGVPRPQDIAREVSAFANGSGGTLVFGIRENGDIVGIQEQALSRAVDAALRSVSGEVRTGFEVVPIDGRVVGVLSVERSGELVSAHGSFFTRSGTTSRPIGPDEVKLHLSALEPQTAIGELSLAVSHQTQTIEKLRADLESANSPSRKILIALLGASAGALLKYLLGGLF